MRPSVLFRTISAAAVIGAMALPAVASAQPYRPHPAYRYEHRDYHHGGPPVGAVVGGALLGLGVGAVLGGVLAPPPPAYYAPPPVYYAPPPPTYYAPPPPVYYGY